MKVLMILNHAPDYREAFLRELGKYKSIDLTVIAQPCEPYGLTPPDHREGYQYIEINSVRFFGLLWQPGLGRILRGDHWDVVCASANFRHLAGLFLFMTNPGYQQRWVWWGHIYGRSSFKLLTYTRKWFLGKAAVILVHSKSVAVRLIKDYGFTAVSFNNTEIMKREFRAAHFNKDNREIRLLFVGRYSPRKKLDYLVQLANRRQEIKVRFVGPGMETLKIPIELITRGCVQTFGKTLGEKLNPHFDWADIVANPGHVGLLVLNAARHGKGIVIDNKSNHAPEHWLAIEADQPFISFEDDNEVDRFIDRLKKDPTLVKKWGNALQEKARKEYTIEHMAAVHVKAFKLIRSGKKNPA